MSDPTIQTECAQIDVLIQGKKDEIVALEALKQTFENPPGELQSDEPLPEPEPTPEPDPEPQPTDESGEPIPTPDAEETTEDPEVVPDPEPTPEEPVADPKPSTKKASTKKS